MESLSTNATAAEPLYQDGHLGQWRQWLGLSEEVTCNELPEQSVSASAVIYHRSIQDSCREAERVDFLWADHCSTQRYHYLFNRAAHTEDMPQYLADLVQPIYEFLLSSTTYIKRPRPLRLDSCSFHLAFILQVLTTFLTIVIGLWHSQVWSTLLPELPQTCTVVLGIKVCHWLAKFSVEQKGSGRGHLWHWRETSLKL